MIHRGSESYTWLKSPMQLPSNSLHADGINVRIGLLLLQCCTTIGYSALTEANSACFLPCFEYGAIVPTNDLRQSVADSTASPWPHLYSCSFLQARYVSATATLICTSHCLLNYTIPAIDCSSKKVHVLHQHTFVLLSQGFDLMHDTLGGEEANLPTKQPCRQVSHLLQTA